MINTPTDQHGFRRVPTDSDRIIVEPVPVETIAAQYEQAGIPFRQRETIFENREALLDVCRHYDMELATHLVDVGIMSRILLSDETFYREFMPLLKHVMGRKAAEEGDLLFQEEGRERFATGMEFHDIGKLHPEINDLIHKEGKLSEEEVKMIQRHPGVHATLDALGINDDIVQDITLFHHWPHYAGEKPHRNNRAAKFLAKCIDIQHAMNEYRSYRKRGMIWWTAAKQALPDNHVLKHRRSIEEELREKSPEDQHGELITLFLGTMQRRWDEISAQLSSKILPAITSPTLPDHLQH